MNRNFFSLTIFSFSLLFFSCGNPEKNENTDSSESTEESQATDSNPIPEPAAEYEINEFIQAVIDLPGDNDAWNGKEVTVSGVISKYGVSETNQEGKASPFYTFHLLIDPKLRGKVVVPGHDEVQTTDELFSVAMSNTFTIANKDWNVKAGDTVKVKATFYNRYPANIYMEEGELVK